MPLTRGGLLAGAGLPPGGECLAEGRALARDWTVGSCAFLREYGVASEAEYKRQQVARGRIMLHAQLGLRDVQLTRAAWTQVYERCAARGVRVDRYGICLDWSMGYPRGARARYPHGTGVLLDADEDFAGLTDAAPVAPHFGDFVLGFPAALENTRAALAAGATSIGNLGQYFTFRLRYWDDDVATTVATLRALGLIAAQDTEVLVHSNLDDGFAAQFSDLACALGAALIEQYIVQDLAGCRLSHCYGHHFSEPLTRWAFHKALAACSAHPGTMIYGATLSYTGKASENFASLGGYLLIDVLAQLDAPSGHALNPVPVTENERIPDADEIVAAQCYAGRLIEVAEGYRALVDGEAAAATAQQLLSGAQVFKQRVLNGLAEAGIRTDDAAEMLLALRRLGARRLEAEFGPGDPDPRSPYGRRPQVPAGTLSRLQTRADAVLQEIDAATRAALGASGLSVLIASTDVHEHGKWLVERVLLGLQLRTLDGGVSVDPQVLAAQAAEDGPDLIALSTYNGMAMDYYLRLREALDARGLDVPVAMGGRLNQIPEGSNTSLPVEVGAALTRRGALVCRDVRDVVPLLSRLARADDLTHG